jgi:threonine dehydrogenase-like Zn-dependent dehydrogenase
VWFTAPHRAELREEPLPDLGEGEILVRGLTSLVSPGTEMNVYRGEVGTSAELGLPTRKGDFPFPIKYAYQIVGEVIEAGPSAGFAAGERVFCAHPHQDYFVIPAPDRNADQALVYGIPADLDSRRAVFTNLFSVAYNTLLDVPVRIGDVVAISGLGVIGHFAAHLVRPIAARLVLVDPLPQRRERAAWTGADAIVGPSDAVDVINELSEGRGADVYIEASGATAALQGAIDATGVEGTIGVLSYYGRREATLKLAPAFPVRRQRIVGSYVSAIGSGLQPRWTPRRRTQEAMRRLAAIDTDVVTTHTVAFHDAPQAYEMIDTRPEETLGVLIDYGQAT